MSILTNTGLKPFRSFLNPLPFLWRLSSQKRQTFWPVWRWEAFPWLQRSLLKTRKPARFIRKKAKDYGTCQIGEGGDIKGKTLCLIEDVITTGGQAMLSAKALEEAGAKVCAVFMCDLSRRDTLIAGKTRTKTDSPFYPKRTDDSMIPKKIQIRS